MNEPLLEVRGLHKTFGDLAALTDVSFDLPRSATLGIVGESGSGKSTLARCILRAVEPDAGSVRYAGGNGWVDLHALPDKALMPLRRELQMVFQDPYASLNPRMTVRQLLEEPLLIHRLGNARARLDAVVEMLERVDLPREVLSRYPHAFSGGQRQRISIARSLILRPRLVICDEAVSALDVSVQAQIINLLQDLQDELGLTYIFIAHDLSVVRHLCDGVLVMYQGRVVERGSVQAVFEQPQHDYTRLLLSAIPSTDPDVPLAPLDRRTLNLVG